MNKGDKMVYQYGSFESTLDPSYISLDNTFKTLLAVLAGLRSNFFSQSHVFSHVFIHFLCLKYTVKGLKVTLFIVENLFKKFFLHQNDFNMLNYL
jgi:hypothetical protein